LEAELQEVEHRRELAGEDARGCTSRSDRGKGSRRVLCRAPDMM
jgi:hypothetical protein